MQLLHSGVLLTVLSGAKSQFETDKSVNWQTVNEATVVSQVGSRNHVQITFMLSMDQFA